jgi:hypothetical protein
MAPSLRGIGLTGAALLLVGLVVVGAASSVLALAGLGELNCEIGGPGSCGQSPESYENESITAEYLLGAGLGVLGGGLGLLVATIVLAFDRREPLPLPFPPGTAPPEPAPVPRPEPSAPATPPPTWASPPTWDPPRPPS